MVRKLLTEVVIGLVILGLLLAALFVAVRGGYVTALTVGGLHAELAAGWWSVSAWVAATNDFYTGFRALPLPPEHLGFAIGSAKVTADGVALGATHVYVSVPVWFIAAILLPPPLLALRGRLGARARRHAEQAGLCAGCGLDLRGFSAGERCPTCGRLIEVPPPGDPIATR